MPKVTLFKGSRFTNIYILPWHAFRSLFRVCSFVYLYKYVYRVLVQKKVGIKL